MICSKGSCPPCCCPSSAQPLGLQQSHCRPPDRTMLVGSCLGICLGWAACPAQSTPHAVMSRARWDCMGRLESGAPGPLEASCRHCRRPRWQPAHLSLVVACPGTPEADAARAASLRCGRAGSAAVSHPQPATKTRFFFSMFIAIACTHARIRYAVAEDLISTLRCY